MIFGSPILTLMVRQGVSLLFVLSTYMYLTGTKTPESAQNPNPAVPQPLPNFASPSVLGMKVE